MFLLGTCVSKDFVELKVAEVDKIGRFSWEDFETTFPQRHPREIAGLIQGLTTTRWASSAVISRGFNSTYKGYNHSYPFIMPIIGVITPSITSRAHLVPQLKTSILPEKIGFLPQEEARSSPTQSNISTP